MARGPQAAHGVANLLQGLEGQRGRAASELSSDASAPLARSPSTACVTKLCCNKKLGLECSIATLCHALQLGCIVWTFAVVLAFLLKEGDESLAVVQVGRQLASNAQLSISQLAGSQWFLPPLLRLYDVSSSRACGECQRLCGSSEPLRDTPSLQLSRPSGSNTAAKSS